tara:strand:- start:3079 stop:3858 length:780 start_codon:yes stop_codon:yes gene_type:complete
MINNKYKIEKYLTRGNFGDIIECSYKNKKYAMKCSIDLNVIKYEANIYKELRKIKNISKMIDSFLYNDKYYLVLELFNMNLKEYKLKFIKVHDYEIKVHKIMIKVIDIIKDIHYMGIIHRDLKPDNICLNVNLQPFIIDFGLAKKIINNTRHIEERKIKNLIGSPNYISLNVVKLIEPSRRDDIESLFYIYMYMLLSDLVWIEYTKNPLEKQKELFLIKEFLNKNKLSLKLLDILTYLRKLHFSQSINYNHLIILYKNI